MHKNLAKIKLFTVYKQFIEVACFTFVVVKTVHVFIVVLQVRLLQIVPLHRQLIC